MLHSGQPPGCWDSFDHHGKLLHSSAFPNEWIISAENRGVSKAHRRSGKMRRLMVMTENWNDLEKCMLLGFTWHTVYCSCITFIARSILHLQTWVLEGWTDRQILFVKAGRTATSGFSVILKRQIRWDLSQNTQDGSAFQQSTFNSSLIQQLELNKVFFFFSTLWLLPTISTVVHKAPPPETSVAQLELALARKDKS